MRYGVSLNRGLSAGKISAASKQPRAFDPDLIEAVQNHSLWMLDTDSFSHLGVGGSSPDDRTKAAGYEFTGSWTWAEDIAMRYSSSPIDPTEAVLAHHESLFRSPGHRANMPNFVPQSRNRNEVRRIQGRNRRHDHRSLRRFRQPAVSDRRRCRRWRRAHRYDPDEGLNNIRIEARSSTGEVYTTSTWNAGGYSLEVPARSYTVTFSGAGLSAPFRRLRRSAPTTSRSISTERPTTRRSNLPRQNPIRSKRRHLRLNLRQHRAPHPPPVPSDRTPAADLTLRGTARNDRLQGGDGNDRFYGSHGRDHLDGGNGQERLEGGSGNDRLYSGLGDDWLQGGYGADLLARGSGADRFAIASLFDRGDRMTDFGASEGDRLDLSPLFDRFGYGGNKPVKDSDVRFAQVEDDVQVDLDRNGGGNGFRSYLTNADTKRSPTSGEVISCSSDRAGTTARWADAARP